MNMHEKLEQVRNNRPSLTPKTPIKKNTITLEERVALLEAVELERLVAEDGS